MKEHTRYKIYESNWELSENQYQEQLKKGYRNYFKIQYIEEVKFLKEKWKEKVTIQYITQKK